MLERLSIIYLGACATIALAACTPQKDEANGADPNAIDNVVVYEVAPADNPANNKKFDDYEAFKSKVYKEPFEGGGYIVNGDTPIPNEEGSKKFYSDVMALKFKSEASAAIVIDAPGGKVAGWTDGKQKNLTYCVSNGLP